MGLPRRLLLLLPLLLPLLLLPRASTALLVGGSVVPHGDFALVPALLDPASANYSRALALHVAARASAAALRDARPDVVLLVAPHAVALTAAFAIYESSALLGTAVLGGDLHNASAPQLPFTAAAAGAPVFASALAANLSAAPAGSNVSGLLAFGDSVPMPIQWSEVVPMSLLADVLNGTGAGFPQVAVWAQPQRRLTCASCMVPELLALGAALAAFADAAPQRVWVLVSADLSHVHSAGVNPYPPNDAVAARFDAAVGVWAAALDRDALVVTAAGLADEALSCGFTGLVLLEGALRAARAAPFTPSLMAGPSAPTYYGMMVAVFAEASGAAPAAAAAAEAAAPRGLLRGAER